MDQAIGFIGAGQMARALAAGFVKAGLVEAGQVSASDPVEAGREGFAAAVPGSQVGESNADVAAAAGVIFLAVKPQHIGSVLSELRPLLGKDHLVVSIAAGVTLATLAGGLEPGVRLARVMPNTPCLVGMSASGFAVGESASDADVALVERLLAAVGVAQRLDEKLLDAVTGLSGSGPAFVYMVIEALSDGGVLKGLPRPVASLLAAQTVRGAAEMVLTTGEHPAALKDRVTSPGGTTIAGLEALEAAGLRSALIAAVDAATERSMELGREKS